jgi:hypothetical protein
VLLDRYKCPVVRTRFLGNIASPVMSASPIETVRGLWVVNFRRLTTSMRPTN